MNKQLKLKAAIDYQEQGLSVIPIKHKDKKPRVKWKQYQEEKADKQRIEEWFSKYPNASIGIVTGEISDIAVIDIEKGGSTDEYPPTVTAKTGGGGYHLYYRYPESGISNSTRTKELTDIRGDGGYVIAPPSMHPSGNQYEWIADFNDVDMKEFPLDSFTGGSEKNTKTDLSHELNREVPEGERNNTATKVAGHFFARTPRRRSPIRMGKL